MLGKLKPLGDRALIKRLEVQEKTAGGLYIPEAAKEKPQTAEVIAVGPGRVTPEGKVIPVAVKAGDMIFVGKYAGTDVGNEHSIVREDEILGVLGS